MSARKHVGIYGIGTYLPDQVRTNDWWPESVVAKWQERVTGKLDRPADSADEASSEASRLILAAMAELRADPFKGSQARRVIADGMLTSDMEVLAAERAIARAGVPAGEIDLFLGTTTHPDYLMVPNVCRTHERLHLARRCLSLHTEGVCNSFMQQLALAEQMIAGGAARYALLVQSAATTRYMRTEDPMSAWFGDGATAVVVGPVGEGFGILGRCHETHGVYYEGLVCGIPDKRWHEGQAHAYIVRPELSRRLLLETVERSTAVVGAALAEAGFEKKDVDFYAAHQGFAWLRKVTQKLTGLEHARTVDTFPWAGSMLGSNIPLVLSVAEHEGLLASGDLVASFSGAAGATLASLVFRWGGRE